MSDLVSIKKLISVCQTEIDDLLEQNKILFAGRDGISFSEHKETVQHLIREISKYDDILMFLTDELARIQSINN